MNSTVPPFFLVGKAFEVNCGILTLTPLMGKKFSLFAVLFSVFCLIGKCQDYSNKGKDFWLCYPAHIDGNSSRMALYISSDVNTSGMVFLAGSSIAFSVTANQATVVQIFPTAYSVINPQNEGIKNNAGIHVVSNDPVVVYAHILNAARSGSSLILPTKTLGREYTATSFRSTGNSTTQAVNGSPSGSQFTVVGVEDNTTVEITPSATDVAGNRPVGIAFTVSLNQGDVYQFRTTYDKDVTGTKIRSLATGTTSCKPIAVFSGSSWTSMDCTGASGGDNLFQQLMPLSAWGKNYITAPFADRQYDIFRIIVKDPTTQVTLNGVVLNASSLVNNTYYQFSSSAANVIATDKPVMVVQYMVSQTCDTRNNGSTGSSAPYPGDPEMVILNPIEQTVNDVTVVSARNNLTPPNTNITKHFFTIILKTDALTSLKIDGNPPTGTPVTIGTTGYSYIQENVTASTNSNPSHRIKADSGFIALAYGLGSVESYGYNAGTNVKDLYQFVSIQNQYATVSFPSTCRNTPFRFTMTFPYQPTSVRWVFGPTLNAMGINDVTLNSPVPDSSKVVNGKILYWYGLPSSYIITAIGTYPIKVIAQNPTPDGCSGEQEIDYDVQVFERPKADFTSSASGCTTDSVRFVDSAKTYSRPTVRWSWDFDDGQSSAQQNPAHLYGAAGLFNVKFSVITDIGCVSDTAVKQVVLTQPPVAKFGILSPPCVGKSITLNDSSTSLGGAIVKWTWDFGDGSPSIVSTTNAQQSHTYTSMGTYPVTLQVVTNTGCVSQVQSKPIVVSPIPVPGFSMPGNCINDPVSQFFDTSSIADGSQNQFTYVWSFGDVNANPGNPNTSTLKNALHKFTATGNYNVKLVVTSNQGCADSISQIFTINGAVPVSTFSIQGGTQHCSNDSIRITDNSSVFPGRLVKLEIYWDYAGNPTTKTIVNNPASLANYSFKYPEFFTPATKSYVVRVVAYSGVNCLSSSQQTITLLATPDINFPPVNSLCGNAASFQISASVINMTGGNGVFSGTAVNSLGIFNPQSTMPGTYQIRYAYTAINGCTNYKEQSITVYPVPTVNAGPDKFVLEGGTATLAATANGIGLTYLWTPATYLNNTSLLHPITAPSDDITYTLKVTSADGCIASDQVLVKVLKTPTIPNVFTPNGDGINDKWEIQYLESYPGATVDIFNRYGSLVYHSIGYGKAWDGTYNGKPMPAGTYYYIINPKNGRKQITGFVDIVR